MNTNDLRRTLGIFSIIALIADITTILVFLKDIFIDQNQLEFKFISTQILFILFIFSIAIFFGYQALKSDWENSYKQIGSFFCWIYIFLSALILATVSYRFIILCNYSFVEYIGMIGLIILITSLALYISYKLKNHNPSFAIPYMLVFLYQILLFLYNFISHKNFDLSWYFCSNFILLTLTALFLAYLISEYDYDEKVYKFKNPFYFK